MGLCNHCGEEPQKELEISCTDHDIAVDAVEGRLWELAANDPEEDGFFLIAGFCSEECLELNMEMESQLEKD